MELDLTLTVGMQPDDEAFVLSTWAESFRHAPACKALPTGAFHTWHRPRMEGVLKRYPLVVVARGTDPLFIYGYGVFERIGDRFVAHWLYVKRSFRRKSVASQILAHALERIGEGAGELLYTHRTYVSPKAEELGFRYEKLEALK